MSDPVNHLLNIGVGNKMLQTVIDRLPPAAPTSPMAFLTAIPRLLRRRFVTIVVIVALGVAAGVLFVMVTPPAYIAETRVQIETRRVQLFRQPLVLDDLASDSAAIESQIQVMRSDEVILAVIHRFHLTEDPAYVDPPRSIFATLIGAGPATGSRPSRIASELEETALEAFKARLDITRVGPSYVVAIRFKSPDAKRAARIANAVADAYISSQQIFKSQSAMGAGNWLQQRMQELREQTLLADKAVVDYKTKNNIVTAKGQLLNDQMLSELEAQATAASAQTSEAQARLDQIQRVIASNSTGLADAATVTDALKNPVTTKLRSEYLELSNRLTEWSKRFGKNHLAVVDLRRKMSGILVSMSSELKRLAETYRSELEIARQREALLKVQMRAAVGRLQTANQAQSKLFALESAAKTYKSLYDNFLQRYAETAQKQAFPMDDARIISRASALVTKTQPKTMLILGFSVLGSLCVGFGAGLLRDKLDRVYRTRDQVEESLQVDCVGMIPAVAAAKPPRLISCRSKMAPSQRAIVRRSNVIWYGSQFPYSRFADALRSIKFAVCSSGCRVVGITSSLPDEGKSVAAAALAKLIADIGARVILVDCDLRNPSLSRTMAPGAKLGLFDVISGHASLQDTIWEDPSSDLSFLPSGPRLRTAHTNEVLSAAATKRLFAELRRDYDFVVVDLPPLAPIVDVRATGDIIDAYAFVVEWGRTKIEVAEHALRTAQPVYDKLVGVILNKVDAKRLQHYENDKMQYYCSRSIAKYQRQGPSPSAIEHLVREAG